MMKPVLMVSTEGGVEIEEVADHSPEKIIKEHFDPANGMESFQVRKICKKLGIEGKLSQSRRSFIRSVCRFFVDSIVRCSRSIRWLSPKTKR